MVYQGSKAKYAKHIVPILQEYIDTNHITVFIDGMCGGCNIIDKISCETRIAYDINPYLIDLFNQAVYNPDFAFPEKITREMWDACKNVPESSPPWLVGLVEYFASYSAKGFIGGFALNGARDYYGECRRNLIKQLPSLQGIIFKEQDILTLNDATDALIYLDPPYKGTSKYDFSKDFSHEKFWDKVRQLSQNNKVIVSEQQVPEDFASIWSLDTKRTMQGRGGISNTKPATEQLFILNKG